MRRRISPVLTGSAGQPFYVRFIQRSRPSFTHVFRLAPPAPACLSPDYPAFPFVFWPYFSRQLHSASPLYVRFSRPSCPSFYRVFRASLHQRQPIYARFFRSGRCCICGWLSSGAVRKSSVLPGIHGVCFLRLGFRPFAAHLARPSGVLGPVDSPPCSGQRPDR